MGLENINVMRNLVGMSIDELSKKSGVPKSTLSKITSGITKDPGIETVKAIVYAMGFMLDDLDKINSETKHREDKNPLFTKQEMSYIKKYRGLDDHGKKIVDIVLDEELNRIEQECKEKIIYIDLFDLPASAGFGNLVEGEYRTLIEVPDTALNRNADFCVRVSGDSMKPEYKDGAIVMVKKGQVNVGDVGIFVLDGESYIKELGEGKLISYNKNYPDLLLGDYSTIFVAGKVISKLI